MKVSRKANWLKLIKRTRYVGEYHWYGLFKCICGTIKELRISKVNINWTRSCGCLQRIVATKHGEADKTVEYKTWCNLKERCYLPNHISYKRYGGRGIKVVKRWLGDKGYINFLKDMGRKPKGDYSIDRINNDGNYSPNNCRWATRKQQTMNKTQRGDNA